MGTEISTPRHSSKGLATYFKTKKQKPVIKLSYGPQNCGQRPKKKENTKRKPSKVKIILSANKNYYFE